MTRKRTIAAIGKYNTTGSKRLTVFWQKQSLTQATPKKEIILINQKVAIYDSDFLV
jgi:hypothetical protein